MAGAKPGLAQLAQRFAETVAGPEETPSSQPRVVRTARAVLQENNLKKIWRKCSYCDRQASHKKTMHFGRRLPQYRNASKKQTNKQNSTSSPMIFLFLSQHNLSKAGVVYILCWWAHADRDYFCLAQCYSLRAHSHSTWHTIGAIFVVHSCWINKYIMQGGEPSWSSVSACPLLEAK